MLHYRPPIRGIVLYLYTLIVFWLWQSLVVEAVSTDSINLLNPAFPFQICLMVLLLPNLEPPYKKQRTGEADDTTYIRRCRRQVDSIMDELGDYHTPRAYRMKRSTFWILHDTLLPHFSKKNPELSRTKFRHRDGAKNGIIATSSRLSMALRYFAGGAPADIAVVHGVGIRDVYRSVWIVVDAVHKCPDLAIKFPVNHDDQKHIAAEFKAISRAGFDNCVGAIDGMLIWTLKPTTVQAGDAGPKKFFCGRKKKFGLNMQAVCDARKRFIDVDIRNPGSMSDYLMFLRSSLHGKLEKDGFLKQGMALYGDNAYVNTSYMATPFKSAKGSEDDYNYYHSSVRITIECAFGILVNRWGILRSAMPKGIAMDKTTALVYCLCKLHNFCIDQTEAMVDSMPDDALLIADNGGVPLDDANGNPNQLLHAGHHSLDVPRDLRRTDERRHMEGVSELPRDIMLKIIEKKDLHRPRPIPR